MKFLCDNCKAKYQIADEKVAGKTVRMKCRKCGHQIEVRAAVTETSVASAPPQAPQAPRPPVPRSSLATSLSAAKPRAPSVAPGPSPLSSAFQKNVQDAPHTVPFPAQAGGGSRAIELSVTDEWYVAINGVPVGPVRISELRRKAAAGAVTEDSLCWQEGLEEWRPIRSIPELAQLVREAAQGNRPSLAGPPPPPIPSPVVPKPPPPAPQRTSGIGTFNDRSIGSTPPPPAPQRFSEPPRPAAVLENRGSRSNVVPLHARISSPSVPDRLDDQPHTAPFGGAAHALAPTFTPAPAVAQPVPSPLAAPIPTPQPAPVADPFAITPAPQPLLPPSTASFMPPPAAPLAPPPGYVEQKKGVPLWFWPILLLALGFGGGVAFLVFRPQPPQQPVVIQVPAPTQPATAPTNHDIPPPPTNEPPPAPTETSTAKPTGKIAAAPKSTAATGPKIDLGGLGSPQTGPAPGPGGGTGTNTGGGTFDQAAVERVVANHRAGVKRSCWERVSGPDQKSSVNVTVNATVAPNGTVSSTSSSGDDPVVAKCIEGQVKTWTFPPPGETKQIALPFKFVRQ